MSSLPSLLAGLWLAFSPPASFSAENRNIRFERISIAQGLSMATVTCMLQDSTGFVWLGTQDGLNRYDGIRFLVLKNDPGDPASLTHDWIRSLLEDASGDIWVGTRGGGLNRWHRATDSFTHYRHDPDDPTSLSGDRVWALLQDHAGTLWVGTELSGLNRFDPASGTFERYRHDPSDRQSLSDDQVRALYEDRSRRLWIGTLGGGLNLLDGAATGRESGSFTRFQHHPATPASLSDNTARSILEDHTGTLWIGTFGGLNRFDPASGTFEHYRHDSSDPSSLSEDRVRVLYEDREGRLWIGTDGGLNLFDRGTPKRPSESFSHYRNRLEDVTSLSNDRVMSIYQDRGGVLWIGTEGGGVNKWHPRAWSFSSDPVRPSDLSSNYILSITEGGGGTLWLGTNGNGLNRLDRASGAVTHFRHHPDERQSLGDDRVTALLHDRRGVLWIGTLAGGLDRFDAATETFEHFAHDPEREDSLGADGVMSLFEDRQGVLWIGTFGGGLNRFDGGPPKRVTSGPRQAGPRQAAAFVRFRHDPADPRSLSDDRVTAFAEEAGGSLWIGTFSGGLNRFDRRSETFLRFQNDPNQPSSLSSDTIFSLHLAATGTLWIATQNGLDKLERIDEASGEAIFKSYFERDGLPSDFIYAVHSDAEGRLWLATNLGLSRFDPRTETFKNFDVSHGLQSNEFNMGAHFQSPSGELIFGGVDGFNAFYPDRIELNTSIPPVVLTSFSKLNRPVRLGRPIFDVEQITLDYRDNIFSFEFAALDYTAPEKNQYRYKLEGFDDGWVDIGNRRRVSFTSLDPGHYLLRVMGSNNDGVWNEEGTSIRIFVPPPPWKTWWAYTLYALALSAVVGSFIRSQHKKVDRERAIARHERAQARERERLIAELEAKNAELERFTYTVSHDLKSPLVTIKGFLGLLRKDTEVGNVERMDHDICRIDAAADKMHLLLDQLLELSRVGRQVNPPEEVPLGELAGRALESVGGLIAERGVKVEIAPDLPVVFGDRLRLGEVYQNLLENAAKYMGDQTAPRIEVGVECDGTGEVFYVRDNGIGIDPRYCDKVFGLFEQLDADAEGTGIGLSLVKRIVELHGGRVWVDSEGPGHGSTFRFTLAS